MTSPSSVLEKSVRNIIVRILIFNNSIFKKISSFNISYKAYSKIYFRTIEAAKAVSELATDRLLAVIPSLGEMLST